MLRTIDIRKENGQWRVVRDDPKKKFPRKEEVRWVLHRGETKGPISAHFQFTSRQLLEYPAENGRLTADLTAVIGENEKELRLRIGRLARMRKDENPQFYAVWISDPEFPEGGVFATGEDGNPPPEMDVGP